MGYTAYIGLGSNLVSTAGSPAKTVQAAVGALAAVGTVIAQSSLYRTAPVGLRKQPHFVNAVVCLDVALEPEEQLRELLAIERSFGRERHAGVPKGPRTLDLDLLLVIDEGGKAIVYESPALTVPHPEIANRRFVLAPLVEIAPEMRHPLIKKTMRELLQELTGKTGDAEEEVSRI